MKKVNALIFALPIGVAVSCSAPALRNQFRSYNEAYASALNQQTLLNLARLQNGHPAYYLAIGMIDNRFTFQSQTAIQAQGNLQETTTSTHNTPYQAGAAAPATTTWWQQPFKVFARVIQTVLGGSVSETATAISNPEFQYIPINNETAARQVLEPISTEVFLQLYQQGYPIDQLLRILIERIETPVLSNGQQKVMVNSPSRSDPEMYAAFLRVCDMVRELQKNGLLQLVGIQENDLLGKVAFAGTSRSQGEGAGTGEHGGGNGGGGDRTANPSPKDFSDVDDKGFVLLNTNGDWHLFRKRTEPKFVLQGEENGTNNKAMENALTFLTGRVARTSLEAGSLRSNLEAATNLVALLHAGVIIQTGVNTRDDQSTRLVLRSFNRAMEAVASEEAEFAPFLSRHPDLTNEIPVLERRPILQMRWPEQRGTNYLELPLEIVSYAGKSYKITDPKMDPLKAEARWNRDVFRLMVNLGSLVTVDISKFQRQVLELYQ